MALTKMQRMTSVMTPFPYSVESGTRISDARQLMREHDIHHLPVKRQGELVGVVSDRDLRHCMESANDESRAAKLSVDILAPSYRDQNVTLSGMERFSYNELLGILKEMMNNEIGIDMRDEEYKGHYLLTPYSFAPTVGVKLVNNPGIEFGQGLLECIAHIHHELEEERAHETPKSRAAE